MERILAETGLDPSRLELEVTESTLLGNVDSAELAMFRLKALGVRLALDDFGTGYSSLQYLRRFPFDKLKIDSSFVRSIERAADAAAIVHAVVSLGRGLGMKVTAEGVETAEQHLFLRAAGVHSLQGYRFGRPCPAGRDHRAARDARHRSDIADDVIDIGGSGLTLSQRSIELEPDRFDHRRPLRDFVLDETPRPLGARIQFWLQPDVQQHPLKSASTMARAGCLRDLLDDRLRRCAGANRADEILRHHVRAIRPRRRSECRAAPPAAAAIVTASMRSLPVRCSSMIWPVMFGMASGICPLRRSVIAGPAPL